MDAPLNSFVLTKSNRHSLRHWWITLLCFVLLCFTVTFLLSSYYFKISHLHEDFVQQSLKASRALNLQLSQKIEQQQATIHYLAQDTELLNALAMDNEPEILSWISRLKLIGEKQIFYIQSAKNNKIFSIGTNISNVKDIIRSAAPSPAYSIYRTPSGKYFINITEPLRNNNQITGLFGNIFSFQSFFNDLNFNSMNYGLLIREDDKFRDVITGESVDKSITVLEEAISGLSFINFINEEQLAIPFGITGLYLYAHTSSLVPNIFENLRFWLALCLPALILSYFLAQTFIRNRVLSILNFTQLTGNPHIDKKRLSQFLKEASLDELNESYSHLITYFDSVIKAEHGKRHTAIFHTSNTAFIVCDLSGKILEWNNEIIQLLGGPDRNLFGTSVKDLFETRDHLSVITGMANVRQESKTEYNQDRIYRARLRLNSVRKRSQHVETTIKRITLSGKDAFVFMLYNVTQHVSTERSLLQAKESAEQLVKERHHFYKGLTDEIEPLSEALNQCIIQLTETSRTDEQQRHLDELQLHNDLLSELFTNIKEFAVIETGNIYFEQSKFGLETLLKQVHASTYSRAMQSGADISFYLAPSVPQEIWFDFAKSLQVMSNLVSLTAKRVQGGIVTLTATRGRTQDGLVEIIFEICGQEATDANTDEDLPLSTLPQAGYYGEKGQQLSLAIAERMIKMFAIELHMQEPRPGVQQFKLSAMATPLTPLRDGLDMLLGGKKVLLTYCEHNSISFIGRTLSALGAICEYAPVGDEYCKEVIDGQTTYDAIINCGCVFETVPEEAVSKYCQLLTQNLITITHSFWEPTYTHPRIISLRKPVMTNELLTMLCDKLLPKVTEYEYDSGAIIPDSILFIAEETRRITDLKAELDNVGYTVTGVDEVSKGVDAIQLYRPEFVVIDTGNIMLDSYWLVKQIREMEEEEKLMPVRIIILTGNEYQVIPTQVDRYTLVSEHMTTKLELIGHIATLRQNDYPQQKGKEAS